MPIVVSSTVLQPSGRLAAFAARWAQTAAAADARPGSFVEELVAALELPRSALAGSPGEGASYLFWARPARGAGEAAPPPGTPRWHLEMRAAYEHAAGLARALPRPPPFVLVAEPSYCLDLYACFDGTAGYRPFPAAHSARLFLSALAEQEALLRDLFTAPLSLCPVRRAARVTSAVAQPLVALGRRLESQGHPPQAVAEFLLRCGFTCYAEELGLAAADGQEPAPGLASSIAELWLPAPRQAAPGLESLWRTLGRTAVGAAISRLPRGLLGEARALPLDRKGLELLLSVARADWSWVEPAIFGLLIEQALPARARQALGAHYTPRAYIERLVRPTIEEPLRADWQAVEHEVRAQLGRAPDGPPPDTAVAAVRDFHAQLGRLRVLDPACGAGNFLYVTLALVQQLEAEVQALRAILSPPVAREAPVSLIRAEQFLGLEVAPQVRDAAVLVLGLGALQSHWRSYGTRHPHPASVFADPGSLQCRDAVLAGDESAASWPPADFVIGNPPFVGSRLMRTLHGAGYTQALRAAYPAVPKSADYVLYWWHKAAELCRRQELRRFGLITTKALAQKLGRQVVGRQLGATPPLGLVFVVPNHPWHFAGYRARRSTRRKQRAEVRIAMTVAEAGRRPGVVWTVGRELVDAHGHAEVELLPAYGLIHADLTVGADLTAVRPLRANRPLCSPGVKLHGAGFIVSAEQAAALGLGSVAGMEQRVRPYRNGKDLMARSRQAFVIDLQGLSEPQVQHRFPSLHAWICAHVRGPRQAGSPSGTRDSAEYARNYWLLGKSRKSLRRALAGLPRYIVTAETSRHRIFMFVPQEILADNTLICIASADASVLATLSSRLHQVWALSTGGRLGVGNHPRYNKTRCFDPFPFPACAPGPQARLRELGELLDSHRKQRQRAHPDLTLTCMYNVLEKRRRGEPLSAAEQAIDQKGDLEALQALHAALDAAVFAAYGWPGDLSAEQLLQRLLHLHAERAQEEQRGLCRWLRPELQSPSPSGRTEPGTD